MNYKKRLQSFESNCKKLTEPLKELDGKIYFVEEHVHKIRKEIIVNATITLRKESKKVSGIREWSLEAFDMTLKHLQLEYNNFMKKSVKALKQKFYERIFVVIKIIKVRDSEIEML